MLREKNEKYGDAALSPKRIFNTSDSIVGLYARIDDKLSRIANRPVGQMPVKNDLDDLIGYLILLKIRADVHRNSISQTEA